MKLFIVCLLCLGLCHAFVSPNFVINDLTGVDAELYGGAVAMSGSLLVVGASEKSIDFERQGAAALYHCDKNQCTFFTQLTAFDAADFDSFGYSVAVDGTMVAIGANSKTVGINEFQGAAYIYDCPLTGCTLLAKLTSPTGAAFDDFGSSIAISGNLLVVGADQVTVNGNTGQGQAHLFQCNAGAYSGTCGLVSTLNCNVCASGALFGFSVAISGSFVTVGAPFSSVGSAELQGQALGFDCTNPTTCVPLGAVTTTTGSDESFFGWTVSATGWYALVGSPFENGTASGQGAVYPVDCTGGSCVSLSPLYSSDGTTDDNFGSAVAISGNSAVLSSMGRASGSGAAYLFDCTIFSACKETRQYGYSDLHGGDWMGAAVTITDSLAAIGVPGHTLGRGKVLLFGVPVLTCAPITEGNATWPRGTLSTRVYGSCVEGWIGSPFRDCQSNSHFGAISNPCIPTSAQCQPETYGYVDWAATSANAVANGICKSGYAGSPSRRCMPNAVWSTNIVNLCTRVFCDVLNDGTATYPKTWAGETGRGTCAGGSAGSPTRTCGSNGSWGSVTNPCSNTPCPAETYGKDVFGVTAAGQTATGSCIPGYTGAPQRQCFATGWSTNVNNHCSRITCAATQAGNANFPPGNSGTVVYGSCISGTGNPRMICTIAGQWTTLTGSCV